MPRKRLAVNSGLPTGWRWKNGAIRYQVPDSDKDIWWGRKEFTLGSSYDEALEKFKSVILNSRSNRDALDLCKYDESDILAFGKRLKKSGVYFLIKDSRVVYVGQSVNVFSRIGGHEIAFDEVVILPVENDLRTLVEAEYIKKLRPEMNTYWAGE